MDTTLQVGSSVTNYVGDRGQVIRTEDLMYMEAFAENKDKLLVGLWVSYKHYRSSSKNTMVSKGSKFGSRNKVANSGLQWNRVLCFADLSSPGTGFAILFEDQASAARALKHCMGSAFVGTMFYIVEPRCTRQKYQFGPLVIVRSDVPLIPVQCPTRPGRDLSTLMKKVSFNSAIPTGQQRYFCINECTNLELDMFQIVDTGTCSGTACDRALCLKKDQACGCFHTHFALGNHVGEFDLAFPSPLGKEIHADNTVVIEKHRSLRTTRLFFDDFRSFCNQYNIEDHFVTVRRKVVSCVEYVNNHGGWTVVGWFRQGEVADASDEGAEKVDNERVIVHISLLVPTRPEVARDQEYRSLLVDKEAPAVNQEQE